LAAGWTVGCLWLASVLDARHEALSPLWMGEIALAAVVSLASAALAGLYGAPMMGVRSATSKTLAECIGLGAAAALAWQAVVDDVYPLWTVSGAIAAFVAVTVARYGFEVWLIGALQRGRYREPVVVAGTASDTAALVEFLRTNPEAGFEATAIVGERPALDDDDELPGVPWLGDLDQTLDAVWVTDATGVLVAVNGIASQDVNRLVHELSVAGLPVHLFNGVSGVAHSRLRALPLAHEPFLVLEPNRHSVVQRAAKRVIDVVVASLLLLVTSPILAVSAVLVWAHDRGPVLFRQVRIGKDGRPFTVLKLRTMEVDAEARLGELAKLNERHGPLFKVAQDPRVTPIGAFLRASAVDELPQLFNVLAGHMSVVGPRPALPAEAAQFDEELQARHQVRPGVTGLWQVEANDKASFEEYRRLDLFYVANWSVALDLAVITDTIPSIGRRALRALRRPAPSAPVPVASPRPVPKPAEVGP
jgi:exopolysaccharide biosynthesis polyprenyl glycosylphosphotransferase